MIKFFWDFRGNDCAEIAAHYKEHVDQFITNNNIENATTGINQLNDFYYETWCLVPERYRDLISHRLRPKREWKQ